MKNVIRNHIFLSLMLLLGLGPIGAQVNRTLETTVVDVLAQLPTENLGHSDRLMREVLALGETGILEFTSRLVPAGMGNDVEARFLVNSLAVYAGRGITEEDRQLVESSYRKAIAESEDTEVKNFLIRRLGYCATDDSVGFLSDLLDDENLYKAALGVLETIGTDKAASAVFRHLANAEKERQYALVESLGRMKYQPANETLIEMSDTPDWISVKHVLRALSEIASEESYRTLVKAAGTANYRMDTKEAILSLVNYGYRLREDGKVQLSQDVGSNLLRNCKADDQLHYRAAGLELQRQAPAASLNKTLLKEMSKGDEKYRGAVLQLASETVLPENRKDWLKLYGKSDDDTRAQIVRTLGKIDHPDVISDCIIPALGSESEDVRVAAIKAMDHQEKVLALSSLLKKLEGSNSPRELEAVEETLLRIVDSEDSDKLTGQLSKVDEDGKIVLIHVMAARNMNSGFDEISALAGTGSGELDLAVAQALGSVGSASELSQILSMLDRSGSAEETMALQESAIRILDGEGESQGALVMDQYRRAENKENWLPVLAAVEDPQAVREVEQVLLSGSEAQKKIAVEALSKWRTRESIPVLYEAAVSGQPEAVRSSAYQAYLRQVVDSDHTEDQKLLLIRRILPHHKGISEKEMVIRAAGTLHTFPALVFVSGFLGEQELVETASNTAIRIALPTPTFEGLSGDMVRDVVSRSIDNLTGQDSQYLKIDVREFLENMPKEKGYQPIFNGKDLSGWKGLVEDPIKRSKMSEAQLAREQKKADAEMNKDWIVQNGHLKFVGEGFKNICTVKKYGDFEMLVDWKIGEGGDSGVYLRGTPQVQIWDTALTEVGAQVGSGGLYHNEKNQSKPLLVADNPGHHWNTFRIRMIGDKVTVHLNGILVVDGVTMENYWDRNQGLFPKESIELQAHGEDVEFRDVYVRELGAGDAELSPEEAADGFVSLFNGKDLDQWQGNKKDYLVENGELVVRPEQGDHGNLYSVNEYSDFIFRFEFQLTPGANNGFGIRTPLEGDAAYVGMESQILDNTAEIYADLEEYQYHGSIYGVIPAKRGYLKPVGEWNSEEIRIMGEEVRITLNGTVILEGNLGEASRNGTLDGKDHPGIKREKGHIAFLGHGSELRFRNIRIKDLSK